MFCPFLFSIPKTIYCLYLQWQCQSSFILYKYSHSTFWLISFSFYSLYCLDLTIIIKEKPPNNNKIVILHRFLPLEFHHGTNSKDAHDTAGVQMYLKLQTFATKINPTQLFKNPTLISCFCFELFLSLWTLYLEIQY